MRISDWSSDVCSSDLRKPVLVRVAEAERVERRGLEQRTEAGPEGAVALPGVDVEVVRGRSPHGQVGLAVTGDVAITRDHVEAGGVGHPLDRGLDLFAAGSRDRSEEHTSELT